MKRSTARGQETDEDDYEDDYEVGGRMDSSAVQLYIYAVRFSYIYIFLLSSALQAGDEESTEGGTVLWCLQMRSYGFQMQPLSGRD